MPYSQRVDRNNPGCLIFMIDQSASMLDPIAGAETPKSLAVAEQLNGIIFELVQRCSKAHGEPPRPYFGVAVIGYSTDDAGTSRVGSVFGGQLTGRDFAWTTDLALNPLRLEQRERRTPSGQMSAFRFPVWIDPFAGGGTPMCAAFDLAGRFARGWINQYPNAFPPIVMNMTDGESTDGDPAVWAQRITSLATTDGNVLLFNIGITSEHSSPSLFPSDQGDIHDRYGQQLFNMSSLLPDFMLSAARQHGFTVTEGARGLGLNADLRALMTFLNIGTSVGSLLR